MICCALGILATTSTWLLRVGLKEAFRLVSAIAFATSSLVAAMFVAHHLDHYSVRAHANERTILAQIAAQPVCTGAPKIRLIQPQI